VGSVVREGRALGWQKCRCLPGLASAHLAVKTRGLSEAVEVVVVEEGLGVARTVLSALEAVGRLGAGLDVHAVAVIDTALRVERTEIVGDMHSPAENLLPCVARTAAYSVRIAAVVDIDLEVSVD